MAVDVTGIIHLMIMGLTNYVFGSVMLTCSILLMFFLIVALLIKIPVPYALAIPIPLSVVFVAYGYMPVLIGGLLSVVFMVLAIASFTSGVGGR